MFNSSQIFVDLFNEYTGLTYTINDITEWDMRNVFPRQYKKLVENLWFDPELWKRTQPLTDSQMYTKMLSKNKDIELFVITDTHPRLIETKMNLLNKQYPWIDTVNNLFVCRRKDMITVDCLVDDGIHNLTNSNHCRILLSCPWNKTFNAEKESVIRVKDWIGIYNKIIERVEARKEVEEITE